MLEDLDSQPRWYAVRTKPRHEKAVVEALRFKGFELLLPLYKTRRQWADRVKDVELPLFAGYVFCRFDRRQLVPVLNAPGVLNVVRLGKELAAIDEGEILSLRIAMNSGLTCLPWPEVEYGQKVEIGFGPLAGVSGTVIDVKAGLRIVLSVSLLNRAVAVEVETRYLAPLDAPRPLREGSRLGAPAISTVPPAGRMERRYGL